MSCTLLVFGGFTDGSSSFDQARLIRQNQILLANGIDPSGACPLSLYHGCCVLNLHRHAVGCQSCHSPLMTMMHHASCIFLLHVLSSLLCFQALCRILLTLHP